MVVGNDPCAGFHGGADTSRAAFQGTSPEERARLRKLVLDSIAASAGMTCDEVEVVLGRSHQAVSPRICELRKEGLIHDTGLRRYTRSRRWARVYAGGMA